MCPSWADSWQTFPGRHRDGSVPLLVTVALARPVLAKPFFNRRSDRLSDRLDLANFLRGYRDREHVYGLVE